MKKLILTAALALATSSVFAQNINSQSQASTQSQAGATNAGNAQNITFKSSADGTTTLKTAPALGGQGFYGSWSADSCVSSGGAGVSVLPGIAANAVVPVTDKHCQALRAFERTMQGAASEDDARTKAAMKRAARDIMCQSSEETRRAYTLAGLCSEPFAEAPPPAQPQPTQTSRRIDQQRMAEIYTPG